MYIKLYTISSVIFSLIFLIHFSLKIILYNTIILIPTDFSYSFLTQIFTQNYTIYTIILLFSLIFLSIFHSKSYYIYYYITILLHFSHSKSYYIILLYYYFHFIFLTQKYKNLFTQFIYYLEYLSLFSPQKIYHFSLSPYIFRLNFCPQKIFSVKKKIKKEQHSDFATSPPHHYYPSSKWLSFLDQTG